MKTLVLLLALISPAALFAQSVAECKPVVSQGLADDDLNQKILVEISRLTRVPLTEIDQRKTLKELDRSTNEFFTFATFVLNIGHLLNVNLLAASPEIRAASQAKTVKEAYERTSVTTLMAIVRSAYHNTPNCP